ncbi:hypothetical protein TrVFT333_000070 [Trichoderma virens FT-333]|nr:hypothetical protein TrVFT333_000070 [Trichoderma virens FT-333]
MMGTASNQSCQPMIQAPPAPSKRSSAEAGFDDPVASKRPYTASNWNILAQVASGGQSLTALEISSVSDVMQPNNALALTPQFGDPFLSQHYSTPNVASYTQNSVNVQNSGYSVIDDNNNEHPQEAEANLAMNDWPGFWDLSSVNVQNSGYSVIDDNNNEQPQEAEANLVMNDWPGFWDLSSVNVQNSGYSVIDDNNNKHPQEVEVNRIFGITGMGELDSNFDFEAPLPNGNAQFQIESPGSGDRS